MQNQLKNELHNIISGKSAVRFGTTLQSISRYLSNGTPTGGEAKNTKQFKEQETKKLEDHIFQNNLGYRILIFHNM
jgi:hypothetical protein